MNLLDEMFKLLKEADAGYVKVSLGEDKNIIVCTNEVSDWFENTYDSYLEDE